MTLRNLLGMVLTLAVCPPAFGGVNVIVQKPAVQYRTFDPANPPKEMPALKSPEQAITVSEFGFGANVEYTPLSSRPAGNETEASIRVNGVSVKVHLNITIWTPPKLGAHIKEHEETHRKISEYYYKDANRVVRELADQAVGKTYFAQDKSLPAARSAAVKKALAELTSGFRQRVNEPAHETNKIFDEITGHGAKSISNEEGMKRALAAYEEKKK